MGRNDSICAWPQQTGLSSSIPASSWRAQRVQGGLPEPATFSLSFQASLISTSAFGFRVLPGGFQTLQQQPKSKLPAPSWCHPGIVPSPPRLAPGRLLSASEGRHPLAAAPHLSATDLPVSFPVTDVSASSRSATDAPSRPSTFSFRHQGVMIDQSPLKSNHTLHLGHGLVARGIMEMEHMVLPLRLQQLPRPLEQLPGSSRFPSPSLPLSLSLPRKLSAFKEHSRRGLLLHQAHRRLSSGFHGISWSSAFSRLPSASGEVSASSPRVTAPRQLPLGCHGDSGELPQSPELPSACSSRATFPPSTLIHIHALESLVSKWRARPCKFKVASEALSSLSPFPQTQLHHGKYNVHQDTNSLAMTCLLEDLMVDHLMVHAHVF